jgi:hypothetical protein
MADPPLEQLHIASVRARGGRFRLVCHAPIAYPTTTSSNFTDYLRSQPKLLPWISHSIDLVNCDQLLSCIRDGSAKAISDGSYKEGVGSAAWVITTNDFSPCMSSSVIPPGDAAEQSSYRSKLCGLYTILLILHNLCQFHCIPVGQITIGCDGLSALHTAFSTSTVSISDQSYDIILAIRELRRRLPLKIIYQYVKGHQDDNTPIHMLDSWAALNIAMDSAAKLALRRFNPTDRHYSIPYEPWAIWQDQRKLVHKLSSKLYDIVHGPPALAYWAKKSDKTLLPLVDWEAIGKARKASPRSKGFFVSKHSSGMCGVGKWMKRWKDSDARPCCGEPEDAIHVWLCQGRDSQTRWTATISKLSDWLNQVDTDPDIIHYLMLYLNSWRSSTPFIYTSAPRYMHECLAAQEALGGHRLLMGWILRDWSIWQQSYYDRCRSKRSGQRWVTLLIKKLWEVAWDLWEHRNDILHHQENEVRQTEGPLINRELTSLYHLLISRTLQQRDRYLISLPLHNLLDKPLPYRTQWCLQARDALSALNITAWHNRSRLPRMLQGMRTVFRQWINGSRH